MIPRPGVNATAAGTHVDGTADAGEVSLSYPLTPQRPGVGIASVAEAAGRRVAAQILAATRSTTGIADVVATRLDGP